MSRPPLTPAEAAAQLAAHKVAQLELWAFAPGATVLGLAVLCVEHSMPARGDPDYRRVTSPAVLQDFAKSRDAGERCTLCPDGAATAADRSLWLGTPADLICEPRRRVCTPAEAEAFAADLTRQLAEHPGLERVGDRFLVRGVDLTPKGE